MKITIDYDYKRISFHDDVSVMGMQKFINEHKEFEDYTITPPDEVIRYEYYPIPYYPSPSPIYAGDPIDCNTDDSPVVEEGSINYLYKN